MRCGLHVSIAGKIDRAVDRAVARSCDTFQIFTRNPRSWRSRRLRRDDATEFRRKVRLTGMTPIFAHLPYLANLSSPNKTIHRRSVRALIQELDRCKALDISYIVVHLGSHLGKGRKLGIERVTEAINTALDSSESRATILLENTAGTGNSIGSSFRDLQEIIDRVCKSRVAVCFDTCHAFAYGYDLRDLRSVEATVSQLENSLGLNLIALVHANDSKGELASRIDRHEHIGLGYIGEEGFRAILHTEALRRLPIILETPIDMPGADEANLRRIREFAM
ncbi:deoxyribonuclease IV [Candidatus Bathyarchaeota archaeon]|nr:deoxyribonuclease IV [Candidatus Bathyarchaeota archaeon]